jgi:hypothetical protein
MFVRLKPEEHGRWYSPDDEPTDGEAPRKPAPNWGEIGSAVASKGNCEDKVLFKEAELRWELLHMGTHPSGEGIEQVRNDALGIMMYRPEYHPEFCMYAFSLGVFVQRALLREVGLLGSHPDWWLSANAKHASDVESLAESIRPALDQVAEILKARREARRRRRRKCRGTD